MRTKTTMIIFFTLLCVKAMSQGFEWVKKFQTSQSGEMRCVIVTNDHNYIASGQLNYSGYLMKTDTSGTVIWSKSFSYLSEIFQIQQTSDGGFAFFASPSSSSGCYFVKTNSSCDTLWTRKIISDLPRNNKCFQQTTDNGYILSYSYADTLYLRKLSSTGNPLWLKHFTGLSKALANSVCQTSDGGFLVGANTNDSLPGNAQQDMYIIKTSAIGDTLWTHIIQSPGYQELMGAVETTDHNYALLYYIGGGCSLNTYIRKINSAGTVIWDNSIMTGSYSSFPWALYNTTDHGFIVAGKMQHLVEGTNFDFTVSKIDSLGIEKWVLNYCGPDYDYAYSVAQESDSVYIASGYSCAGGADNKLTLAKISSTQSPTAIQKINESLLFSVFPNPATDYITINYFQKATLEITNIESQIIKTFNITDTETTIDVSGLSGGVYIIKAQSDKGVVVKKFIKE